jgi:adenylate cyclase class 2
MLLQSPGASIGMFAYPGALAPDYLPNIRGLSMIPLEIEVKFYLEDMDAVRERIIGLGAISHGNHFEYNLRFDDADNSLSRQKSRLRLRQDNKAKLTFKSKPKIKDREFKVLGELEVVVSDFETMKQILELLGFFPRQIYEKQRETFTLNDCELCLDVMPYGNFLEIEGGKESIRQVADQLGLQWEKRIVHGYLSIFADLKERLKFPFSDLTFENFKMIDVDFSKYCSVFEA